MVNMNHIQQKVDILISLLKIKMIMTYLCSLENSLKIQIISKIKEQKVKLEECLLRDFVLDQLFHVFMLTWLQSSQI